MLLLCNLYSDNCFKCDGIKCKDHNDDGSVHCCETCGERVHTTSESKTHECDTVTVPPSNLKLLSVICIETSHYVCFAHPDDGRWIFMDSMADRVCKSHHSSKPSWISASMKNSVLEY